MKYKRILIGMLASFMFAGTIISCSNFLDEEQDTVRNTEYFNTKEGIRDLAAGMYYNLRFHFAWEWGFATTNYGVDEFRCGGDASNGMWDSYDGVFASLITPVNVNTALAETCILYRDLQQLIMVSTSSAVVVTLQTECGTLMMAFLLH